MLHCYVSNKHQHCFVFYCYVSEKRNLCFLVDCYVSDKRTLCFGQVIVPVSNKRTLYLYLIATLEISGQSVLCFIVTLVRRTHYIFTTLLRSDLQLIVSDKRALYLYFIALLVTIARSGPGCSKHG